MPARSQQPGHCWEKGSQECSLTLYHEEAWQRSMAGSPPAQFLSLTKERSAGAPTQAAGGRENFPAEYQAGTAAESAEANGLSCADVMFASMIPAGLELPE
ncbi:hypothetical protein HPB52_019425 [Rhipicephalus sanguineus]|uniref:Uncharacterized protein n=1 Tax=Rhipicephalus sanguineus TaxID=34632 RepID=A0A9D4T498_RHISA|nr:hypothetical protein HPB52_019425 [Rhipicephalus sanguineus]